MGWSVVAVGVEEGLFQPPGGLGNEYDFRRQRLILVTMADRFFGPLCPFPPARAGESGWPNILRLGAM